MMHLAFYEGTSLISRLIRWQTRTRYSHVGVVFGDGSIIEAWHIGGVCHNANISMVHGPGTVVHLYAVKELTAEQEAAVEKFLKAQLGRGYDYSGVMRFLSRRDVDNSKRWFCSELTHAAFKAAGVELLATESYRISPGVLSWSPRLEKIDECVTELV